jgi:hypothetical protein
MWGDLGGGEDYLHNKLTFSIFRKATSTGLIIHNDCCHPPEHKNSTIGYLINHMNTYTYAITDTNRKHDLQRMTILSNYPIHTHTQSNTKHTIKHYQITNYTTPNITINEHSNSHPIQKRRTKLQ